VDKEELVTLRTRVADCRYVWVRLLNGAPVEVGTIPGGPASMADGSAWYRFILSDDVRKAINTMETP
jgi:hypothetical protein